MTTPVLLSFQTTTRWFPPGWLDRLERHLQQKNVGMVGPVTNVAPNVARVDLPYSTYRGFVKFAADRAQVEDGRAFEVRTLSKSATRGPRRFAGPLSRRVGYM